MRRRGGTRSTLGLRARRARRTGRTTTATKRPKPRPGRNPSAPCGDGHGQDGSRSVASWNIGGGWATDATSYHALMEEKWSWIHKEVGMGGEGVGGVVLLQDTRITQTELECGAAQWWRYQEAKAGETIADTPVRWCLAPSPSVAMAGEPTLGLKPMGGTITLLWGDLARRATRVQGGGTDQYGRWAAMEVPGAGGKGTVFVSVYRPPGGKEGGGGAHRQDAATPGLDGGTVGTANP